MTDPGPHPDYPAYDQRKRLMPFGSRPRNFLLSIFRSISHYTPWRRYIHYRYPYGFTPEELAFFIRCIDETRNLPGDIFEVGCAGGHTACFLASHLKYSGSDKTYVCIDTFSGFTADDVAFEVKSRNHAQEDFNGFRVNSLKWFKYSLSLNGLTNVVPIQTDVKNYRFERPVSFCLLDVDLYQPTLYALQNIWPVLSPGGIILVDDCYPQPNTWDGSLQAYNEFVAAHGLERRFLPLKGLYGANKIGFIQKHSLK